MEQESTSAEYQRIRQVMQALNFYSARKFAEVLGVSSQYFYDLKAGHAKKMPRLVVDKIVEKFPQFNSEWLLKGEGDMFVAAPMQSIQGNNIHHNTNGSDAKYIAHLEAEIEQLRKEKEDLWQMLQKLMK